jgi:fatty-acid peroxygenase
MTKQADEPARETGWDHSLALLREGYLFMSRRWQRYGSKAFETRLMLERTLCLRGQDAVRFFYEPGAFTRRGGAIPPTTVKLLQGRGSVQMLDGAPHRHRKAMFMGLMTPASRAALVAGFTGEWNRKLQQWQRQDDIDLFPEVEEILCRAVCDWSGLRMDDSEVAALTRDFSAMVAGSGSVGPRNWRGLGRRLRTDRWMRRLIEDIRRGVVTPTPDTAAAVIAGHRDLDGRLLDARTAAVELINVLRPVVAIGRFITFCALALHEHPQWRQRLAQGDETELEAFVHEVRRFYPFFPAVAGRAVAAKAFDGCPVSKGQRVMLDVHGTHHDPDVWSEPSAFRPERFREGPPPDAFLPQGGGDHFTGHRCAGEWITIDIMKAATRLLTSAMSYEVPPQDTSVPLTRMPTRPRSFRIKAVKGAV